MADKGAALNLARKKKQWKNANAVKLEAPPGKRYWDTSVTLGYLCLSQVLKTTLHLLEHYFLKVINQLHETMPSYAELVFHMFKMSSAVDCRGSTLITADY